MGMKLPILSEIESAAKLVYATMPPTPQYSWPLVNLRVGAEVWIKHENHSPVGAFKLRGAVVYLSWLVKRIPGIRGVVAATRGNYGQGVALAARALGLHTVIVVPHGNSVEKNRAILSQGAELIEFGIDFQAALEHARQLAARRGFHMVESMHERLVHGSATYAREFFQGAPPMDRVYVPIGLGSSICGMVAARNALGLSTEIIGVVSELSPSYALSFEQGVLVEHASTSEIADGLACRRPVEAALDVIRANVNRIVRVSDEEIRAAMRALFEDTHNVAEGAGAAAMAAVLKDKDQLVGKRVGAILSGANIDADLFAKVLMETATDNAIVA
jgi:threonine dehydratase